VEARFGGEDEWYKGEIKEANLDCTYAIEYEDGDKEEKVARSLIRACKSKVASIDLSKNGIPAVESGVHDDELHQKLAELLLTHETLTELNLTGR
jgi:hypothetical protein